MDKPCRVVDFLKGSGDPYVEGVGYPCFSPNGQDISDKSKRDIGVMINVIVTYKNKFVRVNARMNSDIEFMKLCRYGENEWGYIPSLSSLTSKDIFYDVEVKYAVVACHL